MDPGRHLVASSVRSHHILHSLTHSPPRPSSQPAPTSPSPPCPSHPASALLASASISCRKQIRHAPDETAAAATPSSAPRPRLPSPCLLPTRSPNRRSVAEEQAGSARGPRGGSARTRRSARAGRSGHTGTGLLLASWHQLPSLSYEHGGVSEMQNDARRVGRERLLELDARLRAGRVVQEQVGAPPSTCVHRGRDTAFVQDLGRRGSVYRARFVLGRAAGESAQGTVWRSKRPIPTSGRGGGRLSQIEPFSRRFGMDLNARTTRARLLVRARGKVGGCAAYCSSSARLDRCSSIPSRGKQREGKRGQHGRGRRCGEAAPLVGVSISGESARGEHRWPDTDSCRSGGEGDGWTRSSKFASSLVKICRRRVVVRM